MSQFASYVLPVAIVLFLAWRWLKFRGIRKSLPILLENGAQIIDVRSREEFSAGSASGAKNIPLGELTKNLNQLNREKPILLCCASGTRSGMAAGILRRNGFENVTNAGPWQNLLNVCRNIQTKSNSQA